MVGTDSKTAVLGKRNDRSHRDRHRVGACLFFAENCGKGNITEGKEHRRG